MSETSRQPRIGAQQRKRGATLREAYQNALPKRPVKLEVVPEDD